MDDAGISLAFQVGKVAFPGILCDFRQFWRLRLEMLQPFSGASPSLSCVFGCFPGMFPGIGIMGNFMSIMHQAVRSTALIKAISKSSPILDRVWAFHVRDSTPQTSIPYPSLFRSAARDQISKSKCPYAKTISKIGEDFEIALIKAVARTVRPYHSDADARAPARGQHQADDLVRRQVQCGERPRARDAAAQVETENNV